MSDIRLSASNHYTRPLPITKPIAENNKHIYLPPPHELIQPRPNIALSKDRKRRLFPLVKHPSNYPYVSSQDTNAPVEFTNKARDEIKKTLYMMNQQESSQSNHNTSHRRHRDRGERSNTGFSDSNSMRSVGSRSLYSQNSSVFSLPQSQITDGSSIMTGDKSIRTQNQFVQRIPTGNSNNVPMIPLVTEIRLEHSIPSDFSEMYTKSTLLTNILLPNGRPEFTNRELIDWKLNDIRSLLIIHELRPEWGNNVPKIIAPNPHGPKYKFQLLPLYCSDEFIIQSLVNSDLYLEANLDHEFKVRSATYIVKTARERHEFMNHGAKESFMSLQKFEWRNIIENYLLNLAVEAQCRYDFKNNCNEFKKWKMQQLGISVHDTRHKIHMNNKEKDMLWQQCQSFVYKRLNLDWKPDALNDM